MNLDELRHWMLQCLSTSCTHPPPLPASFQSASQYASQSTLDETRVWRWPLLFQLDHLDAKRYAYLVSLGASPSHLKILNDAFRTLASDTHFQERVDVERRLIRLLNAMVHSSFASNSYHSATSLSSASTYVQGMNVLAAPIIYALDELTSFAVYEHLIRQSIPTYVYPLLEGVHIAVRLYDALLKRWDKELSDHLTSRNAIGSVVAFPSLLTCCACTPPLSQVLLLWEFYFAFGFHWNVLVVVSQVLMQRQALLATSRYSHENSFIYVQSPALLLRAWPSLQARPLIAMAMQYAQRVPQRWWDELIVPHVKQLDGLSLFLLDEMENNGH